MFSFIFCLESLSQYNEEGLPIVEITEPYFSDDEEGAEKTETPTGLLPFSQKTAEEQAADRAILDRIAELEREDEERERRREAGEIVTSEEETSESEEEDYDDGESEDEHRPKALDSDEEYEEEVWEHSGNESDEEEQEEGSSSNSLLSPMKTVRFADQVAQAMKPTKSTSSSSTIKTKSPSDVFDQMRSKQQAARNSGSGPMVNMANLESTFSNLMGTAVTAPRKKPLIVEVDETPAPAPQAPVLKSSLKPTSKKQSMFKQSRIEEIVEKPLIKEVVKPVPIVQKEEEAKQPPKKLSKFAMARAAAAADGSAALATHAAVPSAPIITPSAKPAKLGVSDLVFERDVPSVAPTMPGLSQVVERDVIPVVTVEATPPTPAITGFKDVIEKTFTKPAPAKDVIENTFTKPSSGIPAVGSSSEGRRKKSLFRQQQQEPQQQPSRRLLPESAFPDSSYRLDEGDEYDITPLSSVPSRPPNVVVASSSVEKGKAVKPEMKTIPVVASSKLRDTALLKGSVVEREEIESVDEDELEDDMLMRQVNWEGSSFRSLPLSTIARNHSLELTLYTFS